MLSHEFSEQERSEVRSDAAEAVKTHYDELVRRWKEEMDTLLVYVSDLYRPQAVMLIGSSCIMIQ